MRLAQDAQRAESTALRKLSSSPQHSKGDLESLFPAAERELKLVEERIRSQFVSFAPVLNDISSYLLDLGGKRIRPLLAVLSARLFGMQVPSESLIDAAAAIELIHMATLLHDDIIDESALRRGKPSAFVRFGLGPTLLAGDFLLVRAFGISAHLDPYLIQATEQACVELTEGEVLEGRLSADSVFSLDDYLAVVERKTASLFALAAKVGTHLAGGLENDVNRLFLFGRLAGTAFQMIDDILDICAEEALLGKTRGVDLRQKTPSLINVLWLKSGDQEARDFFSEEFPSAEAARSAAELLSKSPVLDESRSIAAQYAERACRVLKEIEAPDTDAGALGDLLSLVQFTLKRCF